MTPTPLGPFVQNWLDSIRAQPSFVCENASCGVTFYAGKGGLCYDCGHKTEVEREAELAMARAVADTIPEEYRGRGLETYCVGEGYGDGDAHKQARDWFAASGQWLYLHSRNTGTGKSHIAYALAERELRAGRRVIAFGCAEWFANLKATFSRDSQTSEAALFGAMLSVDLVLLDDLGTRPTSQYEAEALYRLVDGRLAAKLPMIITSQYPIGDLPHKDRIDGDNGRRIASRLAACCKSVQFRCKDYRARGAK